MAKKFTPKPVDSFKTTYVNMRVTRELYAELKAAAAAKEMPITHLVDQALKYALENA